MTNEYLRYFIEAVWTGKRATNEAEKDFKGAGAAGEKGAKGALSFKSALSGLVGAGVLAAAAKQAFDFGKASVNAFSDSEEAYGKFNIVFGDFADGTERDLEAIADATGRSKYELIDYASTIQDTFVPLGFAREEAAKMSTEITQLAIDLASFNNLRTEDVVRDLQSALVGNTETLRKYGVVAQETQIKQELLNLGLWDGTGAIDAQAKAQAILSLTLKGTTDAQGDAVRTADSFANKQRALEAATLDLMVAVGQGLTPVMSDLTELAIEAAGGLNAFFSVVNDGGSTIDKIVDKNIKQADSIDDLVGQYNRIREQQTKWLGVAALLTGTTDDLAKAEQDVKDAIILTAANSDEYVSALRDMGLVTNEVNESLALQYYEEKRKAALMEQTIAQTATADKVMLGYVGATQEAEEATGEFNPALQRLQQEYTRAIQGTEEFKEKTGQSAEELRSIAAAADAFNNSFVSALEDTDSAYGKWVTTATIVGGRTEAQQQNFEDLSSEAEKLRDNINSLQGGTAGLGLTQDELNDKLAQQYERLAQVEGALQPLASITTEYTNAQSKWVVDADALNEQLFGQVAGMSDNAIVTASAAIALGQYDEAQVEAALNAAIMQEEIKALAERFVEAGGEGINLREEMEKIVDGSPYTAEVEALVDEAISNIDKVKSKLDAIDGLVAKATVEVSERTTGSAASGGGASGRIPEFAGGGMVPGPVGSPQLILAHGGEQVLTPSQQQGRGGGDTTNIIVNVPNALNPDAVATAINYKLGQLT